SPAFLQIHWQKCKNGPAGTFEPKPTVFKSINLWSNNRKCLSIYALYTSWFNSNNERVRAKKEQLPEGLRHKEKISIPFDPLDHSLMQSPSFKFYLLQLL